MKCSLTMQARSVAPVSFECLGKTPPATDSQNIAPWSIRKSGIDYLVEAEPILLSNLFMLPQLTTWKHRDSEYVVPLFIVVLFVKDANEGGDVEASAA